MKGPDFSIRNSWWCGWASRVSVPLKWLRNLPTIISLNILSLLCLCHPQMTQIFLTEVNLQPRDTLLGALGYSSVSVGRLQNPNCSQLTESLLHQTVERCTCLKENRIHACHCRQSEHYPPSLLIISIPLHALPNMVCLPTNNTCQSVVRWLIGA